MRRTTQCNLARVLCQTGSNDALAAVRATREAAVRRGQDLLPCILGVPASQNANGEAELKLPNGVFRFVAGDIDLMTGLTFRVNDVMKVRDAARSAAPSMNRT